MSIFVSPQKTNAALWFAGAAMLLMAATTAGKIFLDRRTSEEPVVVADPDREAAAVKVLPTVRVPASNAEPPAPGVLKPAQKFETGEELPALDPDCDLITLRAFDLSLGDTGRFPKPNALRWFQVDEIIGNKEIIAIVGGLEGDHVTTFPGTRFILRGISTHGLADRTPVTLDRIYKVTGTQKRGRHIYFVVQPVRES
jgi:hypothetical protein